MKKGLSYLIPLFVTTLVLFYLVAGWLSTDHPAIVFFLAMMCADKIVEKNGWLIEFYEEGISKKPLDDMKKDR
ncbi:short-chain dehydrogenase [Falsibacillus pallidus]|uniref:Uncharacterized protein n=1 Tax=Falsibacillus pallidus TaxID=493781 RepID=A0A370G5T4_9BACI|nr:short-chain dehydrogenase [Falsibacillus pallidus]RDI39125.1 hypothetical protein DFR59_11532 [Falsibacillus pallidus]